MGKKGFFVVFLLFVAGAVYWHFNGKSAPNAAPEAAGGGKRPAALVSITPVVRKDVPLNLTAVGTVVPQQSVTVRSRLDSQLVEVKFHPGDVVNEGDLLFVLDDRSLKAQIAERESTRVRDQAQEKTLQLQYERKKKLSSEGYETQENLETARAAYESQRATVAATDAALDNLKVQLQYTRIAAPISGRTGTVAITPGNNVKANDTTPLTTINQVKPVWVQVSLPQRYVDPVRRAKTEGAVPATARHEGGEPVTGALDYIDNAIDTTTGTFAVRVLFPNEDERLWPGMFVTVTLQVGARKDALTVPEVAIQRSSSGDFVYVAEEGKAKKRLVKVDFIEGDEAAIAEGLTAEDKVVTDGLLRLEDGGDIRVAGEGAKL